MDMDSPSDVQVIDPSDLQDIDPSDIELIESLPMVTDEDIQTHVSLCTGISSMNRQERIGKLLMYIKSIDDAESLQKEWIRSNSPYPISLNLKRLQEILDKTRPMDTECFNMAVRIFACDERHFFFLEDDEQTFHYMDLQFWTISDFYRDPKRRKKLDVQKLASLFHPWPGMEYDISTCTHILLPHSSLGQFTVYSFDMKSRTVSILDPFPIPNTFKGPDPSLHYMHKLKNIANNFKIALDVAHPDWNDDMYVWKRILPKSVPKVDDWNMSGYLAFDFMRTWDGKHMPFICMNGDKLRSQFLIDLLNFGGNEAKDNIPQDIQELAHSLK